MGVILFRGSEIAVRAISIGLARFRAGHLSKKDPLGCWSCWTKRLQPIIREFRENRPPPIECDWPITSAGREEMARLYEMACLNCKDREHCLRE